MMHSFVGNLDAPPDRPTDATAPDDDFDALLAQLWRDDGEGD